MMYRLCRYMVYMDENGDAEGNYTLIALDNRPTKGHGLYPIAYFVGKENGTNLPVSKTLTDSLFFLFFLSFFFFFFFFSFVVHRSSFRLQRLRLTRDISWIGDGPPIAEPRCGYHGEKCTCTYTTTPFIISRFAVTAYKSILRDV